jgi:hypothetical protein
MRCDAMRCDKMWECDVGFMWSRKTSNERVGDMYDGLQRFGFVKGGYLAHGVYSRSDELSSSAAMSAACSVHMCSEDGGRGSSRALRREEGFQRTPSIVFPHAPRCATRRRRDSRFKTRRATSRRLRRAQTRPRADVQSSTSPAAFSSRACRRGPVTTGGMDHDAPRAQRRAL